MRFNALILFAYLIVIIKTANSNICVSKDASSNNSSSSSEQLNNEPCFDLTPFNYNQNKKGQINHDIDLECYVRNKGTFSVVWLHENQLISLDGRIIKPDSNIQLDTDLEGKFNLKIHNLDVMHKGSYKCQITTFIARNLEYNVDVLVPPTISRLPSNDVISVREGESLSIQCLAQGNPKPKITWTKKGKLPAHVKIDDTKSTLHLKDMDESYADSYSCMAMNGVGNPVTSEFQINIKYKPKVKLMEQEYINNSILYTSIGRTEKFVCLVNSYPTSKMTILFNNKTIDAKNIVTEEVKNSDRKQYTMTYSFTVSNENIGEYTCAAENEIGISKETLKVTLETSEIKILTENSQVYSDAYIFEWFCLSGSPLHDLNIEVYSNDTLVSNHTIKLKQSAIDSDYLSTYHNDNIQYRDFYELTKLNFNQTYTIRIKTLNNYGWSEWSKNQTIKTLNTETDKYTKHKQSILHQQTHHRHQHDRKYKLYGLLQTPTSNDFKSKHERFQSYLNKSNLNNLSNLLVLVQFIIFSFLLFKF